MIEDCPKLEEGPGRVVLATVTHVNTDVYTLRLEDGKILEPTGAHRLFSADRDDWIRTEDLKVGESLRTRGGKLKIAVIKKKPGIHRVYNIEVETEHCYFAGESKVLSHNMNCGGFQELERGYVYRVNVDDLSGVTRRNLSNVPGEDRRILMAIENAIMEGNAHPTMIQKFTTMREGSEMGRLFEFIGDPVTGDITIGFSGRGYRYDSRMLAMFSDLVSPPPIARRQYGDCGLPKAADYLRYRDGKDLSGMVPSSGGRIRWIKRGTDQLVNQFQPNCDNCLEWMPDIWRWMQ